MKNIIKYIKRVGISISILLNVILGGASNQTLSARNYSRMKEGKKNAVWLIDKIFFYEEDHCMNSWTYWILRKETNK